MKRALHFSNKRETRSDLSEEEYTKALKDKKGLLWVDLISEPPESSEAVLRETFGFHPLSIEDALRSSHLPKLDDWEEYLYLVLHTLEFNPTSGQVAVLELDVFLGPNYIVTHHTAPLPALDTIWVDCAQHPRYLNRGADHILYRLTRAFVSEATLAAHGISDALGGVEEEIFAGANAATLSRILTLKRAILHAQRVISPQREMLNRLARDEHPLIDGPDRAYFRDVHEHLVELYADNEGLRDLAVSALDIYLSFVNNRMNEAIKTLTIIAAFFMPLSFLAAFFGMNFFGLNVPLTDAFGGPMLTIALVLMVLTPVLLFVWIRRRGWL